MSDKRKNVRWEDFKAKFAKKRQNRKRTQADMTVTASTKTRDNETEIRDIERQEYITVQRLSTNVEGKCQKYTRIGPLTMVPIDGKMSLDSIKEACIKHFEIPDNMACDVVAGERGPSYKEFSQIKSFKVLHVRFFEKPIHYSGTQQQSSRVNMKRNISSSTVTSTTFHGIENMFSTSPDLDINTANSTVSQYDNQFPTPISYPASLSIASMLNLGKFIPPPTVKNIHTLFVEEFDIITHKWSAPKEVKMSVSESSFASGGFRNAYISHVTFGLPAGKYVMKKIKPGQIQDVTNVFGSVEVHTRKAVQMHSLAAHLCERMNKVVPNDFGETFSYHPIYYAKGSDGESVTIEQFIEGDFEKYINNNGDIILDGINPLNDCAAKAQAFVHFTYTKSNKSLMVLDIQGSQYSLYDPEIASSKMTDESGAHVMFCIGNLALLAIENFVENHKCNKFCLMLGLMDIN